MNAKQAAIFLGIAPDTFAQWRRRGKGPQCVRVDGRTFIYPVIPLLHFGIRRLLDNHKEPQP